MLRIFAHFDTLSPDQKAAAAKKFGPETAERQAKWEMVIKMEDNEDGVEVYEDWKDRISEPDEESGAEEL